MISRKIDLTEHRDFSGDNHSWFTITEIDADLFDESYISSTEYDYIAWWESIFGRRRHTNRKHEIFKPYDEKTFIENSMKRCQRCGKPLKIPWRRYGGLCKECEDDLFKGSNGFLWYGSPDRPVSINEYSPTINLDIFNLR